MKSARISLWNSRPSENPKAPILYGSVELPAQLVWELSQAMQQGQGMEVNQQTGEQFFKLRLSVWRGTGENNSAVLRGEIESLPERAAYLAQKAQQQGGQAWGAPAAPPQQPAYGQPAPQPGSAGYPPQAAPQQPPAGPPAGYPAAPPPAAPPAAAPPAWGQPAAGGWGG